METAVKGKLMQIAIDEAEKAIQEGNSPFGAVLADLEGNVIDTAHNTSKTDPTAHAEINLIRKVSRKIKSKDLSNYCLISNAQSCSMCFSAAIKANIRNFIFGADNEPMDPDINVFELAKYSHSKLNIESGILKDECEKQIEQARNNY